ncbi:hypothetical protein BBJ28_00009320 [Nothophytophthora sp. Chile5]|nr:hypothetical protein BBJ28_00009320 [Nothophytophthora sp. Chile5]
MVFPPLRLSCSAREQYEQTALLALSRALSDYDAHRKWQSSRPLRQQYQMDPTRWKAVKTREQLTVYRQLATGDTVTTGDGSDRTRTRSRTLETAGPTTTPDMDTTASAPDQTPDFWPWMPHRGASATATDAWNMPTLLQVGTIRGSLDDVMYGCSTFDGPNMLLKTSYTDDELVDAETLCEIQGPTASEPFRFLGLKWIVKANPSAVNAFVWPRDLVFLEATGLLDRQGGERVGYHLMHSVDIGSSFGPLEGRRVVRGRVSSCFFYRQTAGNTVDVFMKANFEPNGSVAESVAVQSAAHSLIYCWKAVECAQSKKLAWLLAHPRERAASGATVAPRPNGAQRRKRLGCGVCSKNLGTFSRTASCRVCHARVCSSCATKKKLSFHGPVHKQVERRAVVLCANCLKRARELDTFEVAQLEVAERERLNRPRGASRRGDVVSSRGRTVSRRGEVVSSRGRTASRRGDKISRKDDAVEPPSQVAVATPKAVVKPTPVPVRPPSPKKVEAPVMSEKPAWDFDSEAEDEEDDRRVVSCQTVVLQPVLTDSTHILPVHKRQNSGRRRAGPPRKAANPPRKLIKTVSPPVRKAPQTPTKSKAEETPVVAHRPAWDIDSEAEDDDDYDCTIVSCQTVALHPEVAGSSTASPPKVVVQYAWGGSLASPSRRNGSEPPAPWPSPPSSPLQSPTNLPTESAISWPVCESEKAMVWTPPSLPQIRRLPEGATPQEVLEQFVELCDAAESVYQAARKQTLTHLESDRRQLTVDVGALD